MGMRYCSCLRNHVGRSGCAAHPSPESCKLCLDHARCGDGFLLDRDARKCTRELANILPVGPSRACGRGSTNLQSGLNLELCAVLASLCALAKARACPPSQDSLAFEAVLKLA